MKWSNIILKTKLLVISLFSLVNYSAYSENLSKWQNHIQGNNFFTNKEKLDLKKINLLEKFKERETSTPYEGPIIDVHDHPNYMGRYQKKMARHIQGKVFLTTKEMTAIKKNNTLSDIKYIEIITPYEGPNGPEIIKIKSANNVVHTIVMNTPGDYLSKKKIDSAAFAKKHKNVSALCRADFIGLKFKELKKSSKRQFDGINIEFERIDENLKNKNCIGIGEIGAVHYDKHKKAVLPGLAKKISQGELLLDLNDSVITRALELANSYGVPAVFHIEPFYIIKKINREKEVIYFYKRIC